MAKKKKTKKPEKKLAKNKDLDKKKAKKSRPQDKKKTEDTKVKGEEFKEKVKESKAKKANKKQIEDTILEVSGPIGIQLYNELLGKDKVNEYEIAEKLQVPIQTLRNAIYQFDKHNLLLTDRKKDRKKGWYIYFLTLNEKEIEYIVIKLKKERLKKLHEILKRETEHEIYTCPNKCTRVSTEVALENQFLCIECGEVLQIENNQKRIASLSKSIENLSEELKALEV